jgi:glutamine synthetase
MKEWDHSVIVYWEKKPEVTEYFSKTVREAGKVLDKYTSKKFTVIDATKFTSWFKGEVEFYLFNRISEKTVYPIGISFLTGSVATSVDEAIDPGSGKLYDSAGY